MREDQESSTTFQMLLSAKLGTVAGMWDVLT